MSNLRVSRKLFLSFAIIFVLYTITSVCLARLSSSLLSNFRYFYDHPYRVTHAAMDLKVELLTMRIIIKDAMLQGDPSAVPSVVKAIEPMQEKVTDDIVTLRGRYLGDSLDVDSFEAEYKQWQVVANEALVLIQQGNIDDARALSFGIASQYAADMLSKLDSIIDFADGRANTFFTQATDSYAFLEMLTHFFVTAALILSVTLSIVLTRSITRPIGSILSVINRIESGQDAAVISSSGRKDELGKVIDSFNSMLTYLKTKKELSELTLTLEHQKTLEHFRITLMSIGDAVISTDTYGKITNMNPVAEHLTGWSNADAMGQSIEDVFHIIHGKTLLKAENPLEKVLKLGHVAGLANHTVLIAKDGQWHHIADSAAPIRDAKGELLGVVLVFRDVTEDYRKQEEIVHMSFHDSLTKLYNRAFFEEEIIRMNTDRQMPLSIIMGDVNGLKLINDAFGHHEGDKYLIAAANTLKSCCRAEDVVARWGGDEFVILLPNTTAEESHHICASIIEAYSSVEGFKIKPSIAIGCAVQPAVLDDNQKTLKEAETNMYRHKLLDSSSTRSAIVASLDNSLNEKDINTEKHAMGLTGLCAELGRHLGLNDSACDELELLGRLHDIGKIAISDSILMKPGPLDLDEWAAMKKHSEIGYRIAKSVPGLEHVAEGILSHHERWDGTGYPKGLSGQAIPYSARIIAVVDAYDAMTRGRPYKLPLNHEEAAKELLRCSGTQFDPVVVATFLNLFNAGYARPAELAG